MVLNKYGNIIKECWKGLTDHYVNCILDEFVIMPNHIHGIIQIDNHQIVGTGLKPVPTVKNHGLSEIIRGFKTFSSRNINNLLKEGKFQWQRSFYDHIIRDQKSLLNIRNYIIENPLSWKLDKYNI